MLRYILFVLPLISTVALAQSSPQTESPVYAEGTYVGTNSNGDPCSLIILQDKTTYEPGVGNVDWNQFSNTKQTITVQFYRENKDPIGMIIYSEHDPYAHYSRDTFAGWVGLQDGPYYQAKLKRDLHDEANTIKSVVITNEKRKTVWDCSDLSLER